MIIGNFKMQRLCHSERSPAPHGVQGEAKNLCSNTHELFETILIDGLISPVIPVKTGIQNSKKGPGFLLSQE